MLQGLEKAPYEASQKGTTALYSNEYAAGAGRLTRLVLWRQLLLMKRESSFYVARVIQQLIVGLIVASLWGTLQVSLSDGRQVMSLAAQSTMAATMTSQPQIGLVFSHKRVFYKQRDNHLFPSGAYVASFVITQLPASTLEVLVYSLCVYWITGGWVGGVNRGC